MHLNPSDIFFTFQICTDFMLLYIQSVFHMFLL